MCIKRLCRNISALLLQWTNTAWWSVRTKSGVLCWPLVVVHATEPMYSVVFTSPPLSHHGSAWLPTPVISLLLTNTISPVRACLSIWWERFCGGPKRKGALNHLVIFHALYSCKILCHPSRQVQQITKLGRAGRRLVKYLLKGPWGLLRGW